MKKTLILWAALLAAALTHPVGAQQTFQWGETQWTMEDASGKAALTVDGDVWDIVAPDGLTLWLNRPLSGNYEISYYIQVVTEGGRHDRLADMNCFWGAKDPEYPDNLFARSQWRKGAFDKYNSLNLFYVGYGGNENSTTRFRQYHGELYGRDEANLKPVLKEYTDAAHLLTANRWYEIVITATDSLTTYARDGEILFSLPTTPGQTDGHFALRLWKNHVRVSHLAVRTAEQQFAYTNYRRYAREAAMATPDAAKQQAMLDLRRQFQQHPYRAKVQRDGVEAVKLWSLLNEDGTFFDLNPTEDELKRTDAFHQGYLNTSDDRVGIFISDALNRIHVIADAGRQGFLPKEQMMADKVMKAILHYGDLEIARPNDAPRFHASCFAMPTAAQAIYFAYLEAMDQAERSTEPSWQKEACAMLKVLGLQAYTQPLRRDATDANVVSVERFRKHVWWVGGNALAYRSLLPVAAMFNSVPMVDVLADVCQRSISTTSQTTLDGDFWIEGFTADGAGWGHGRQCLIWGYPIDGTNAALNMLSMLKHTPWNKRLSAENVAALMNFFRGGNWYYYKGYRLPGLDRYSYVYNPDEKPIPYQKLLRKVLDDWSESFTEAELEELRTLDREVKANRIEMAGRAPGVYNGTRWFFNNDDLMKKTTDYHLSVNMASLRSDGLESAAFADNYNFYPTDGMTLFQRSGDEYFRVMGGWDVTASPGVTAREGMERLIPVTNWRGYCSKHDFAAGATDGGPNAAAGFRFEKIHGGTKKNVNDRGDIEVENKLLYGFRATKGYFILGDYFVALGAGVTNDSTQVEGNLRTTIDQTVKKGLVQTWRKGKTKEIPMGTTARIPADGRTWVMQEGGFAYTVLPQFTRDFQVACETRPTNWMALNPSNKNGKNLPAEVSILRLWTDHGREVKDDTYGYVVYLGQGMPAAVPPVEVLRNDAQVQAVRSADKQVLGAVFYDASERLVYRKGSLQVSAPCAVLLQRDGEGLRVSVADARMDAALKSVTVTVDGREVKVDLPQGKLCGKPATVVMKGTN